MNSRNVAKQSTISLMYGLISFRSTHFNADVTIASKRPLWSMHIWTNRKRSPEVNYYDNFFFSLPTLFVGSIRRRRSLGGLVQPEPNLDLIQPQNPFDDTPMRSTPPDAGLVAQSSSKNCINANTLEEETIRHIADTTAKTLEQSILHGRLSGLKPHNKTINKFNRCMVRPGGGTGYTMNVGGKNNKGAGKYTNLFVVTHSSPRITSRE
jgi:hypothetical protein